MENINNYLIIILSLMVFYYILMLYIKYGYKQSQFTPVDSNIPDIEKPQQPIKMKSEPDLYLSDDTRMQFPTLPPVNPTVRNSQMEQVIPASPDLFTSQTYDTNYSVLDTPPTDGTNQLNENEMISIPLQYNYPYNEQLRSQSVLVTPYNKIKYGTC